jgi:uncharacterized protein
MLCGMSFPDTPTPPRERYELIDALRGFALFGVLLVNLESFSLYDLLSDERTQALTATTLDRGLDWLADTFVSGTAITLFSLLFGVGFSLQMRRGDHDPLVTRRYLRRLLVLLGIGVLHTLLWWGDILRYYAVLGMLLVPLWRLRGRTLAWVGALLVVAAPLLLQPWLPALLPKQISIAESAARSLAAFSGHDWRETFHANIARALRMLVAVWILPTYVLGRLMIGVALGRSGRLQEAHRHLRFWRRLLLAMLVLSALAVLVPMHPAVARENLIPWPGGQAGKLMLHALRQLQPLCLGLTYMAGFVLLYQHPATRRGLAWLAPVGRMALTNYISQTVIAIALFYGIGLGLGPVGPSAITATAILIFAVQTIASRWWLSRYRQGPVEWVWRRLTYGRMPAALLQPQNDPR